MSPQRSPRTDEKAPRAVIWRPLAYIVVVVVIIQNSVHSIALYFGHMALTSLSKAMLFCDWKQLFS